MKISACVIAKNEEKNIVKWLETMRGVADEMIVVDTGSADKTATIALDGGAKVFHFAWRNDFAAAKNYAIGKATGDWIAFLDADEYFAADSAQNLRAVLQDVHGNKRIIAVNSLLTNIDIDNGNRIISTMTQTRIFRRLPQLKYVGKIHESLVFPKSKKPWQLADTSLVIIHTGYSESLTKQKNLRNLDFLLGDIAEKGGETPEHCAYLSTTYYNLKDYENTVKYAKRAIATKAGGVYPIFVKQFRLLLYAKQKLGAPLSEQQAIIDEGLCEVPNNPDLLWEDGELALKRCDYLRLEGDLALIFAAVVGDYHKTFATEIDAHFGQMCAAYAMLLSFRGQNAAAAEILYKALQNYPQNEKLLRSYLRQARDNDPAAVLSALQKIYGSDKERQFAAKAVDKFPRNAVYSYFAASKDNTYEACLAANDAKRAAQKAANALVDCFFMGLKNYRDDIDRAQWEELLPAAAKVPTVKAKAHDYPADLLLKATDKFIRETAFALIILGADEMRDMKKEFGLLPAAWRHTVARYYDSGKLAADDFAAYRALAADACIYAPVAVINRLAALAVDFPAEYALQAAEDFFSAEQYAAVLIVQTALKGDAQKTDGDFWYRQGRALFAASSFSQAAACFQNALDKNAAAHDVAGFLAWSKELAKTTA